MGLNGGNTSCTGKEFFTCAEKIFYFFHGHWAHEKPY